MPQHRPEPPGVVRTAVALMYVGAGLTILSGVVFFATTDRLAEALTEASTAPSPALVDAAVDRAEGRELFRSAVGVCLWIWMAVKNREGRRWARGVATAFGVINVAGLLLGFGLVSGLDSGDVFEHLLPQLVLGIGSALLGVVILVQLYAAAASDFYDESARYQAAMTLRGYR